jgi:hypothetical protein
VDRSWLACLHIRLDLNTARVDMKGCYEEIMAGRLNSFIGRVECVCRAVVSIGLEWELIRMRRSKAKQGGSAIGIGYEIGKVCDRDRAENIRRETLLGTVRS